MAVDVVLTWAASASPNVAKYVVTWNSSAVTTPVVKEHPATDTTASYVTDSGVTPVPGTTISATIAAVDSFGQSSSTVPAVPETVKVPTPPPPAPPTNVVLALKES